MLPPVIDVDGVLVSSEVITEMFCCDLEACHGQCCVEGDAGAPVTLDEVAEIEGALDVVWGDLSAAAQAVVDRQGVVYTDGEGDLVTSIVGGRDCVFTRYDDLGEVKQCCLCALEKAYREGRSSFCKPISCALYPIREKRLSNGVVGLNYNKWNVCDGARRRGRELGLPLYRFLREPLVRRFGEAWYEELETVVSELRKQGYL